MFRLACFRVFLVLFTASAIAATNANTNSTSRKTWTRHHHVTPLYGDEPLERILDRADAWIEKYKVNITTIVAIAVKERPIKVGLQLTRYWLMLEPNTRYFSYYQVEMQTYVEIIYRSTNPVHEDWTPPPVPVPTPNADINHGTRLFPPHARSFLLAILSLASLLTLN